MNFWVWINKNYELHSVLLGIKYFFVSFLRKKKLFMEGNNERGGKHCFIEKIFIFRKEKEWRLQEHWKSLERERKKVEWRQ